MYRKGSLLSGAIGVYSSEQFDNIILGLRIGVIDRTDEPVSSPLHFLPTSELPTERLSMAVL